MPFAMRNSAAAALTWVARFKWWAVLNQRSSRSAWLGHFGSRRALAHFLQRWSSRSAILAAIGLAGERVMGLRACALQSPARQPGGLAALSQGLRVPTDGARDASVAAAAGGVATGITNRRRRPGGAGWSGVLPLPR